MTAAAILARLSDDRDFWRQRAGEAQDDSYGRLAAQSRVELLSTLLTWLPRELDRLVIEARADEDCPNCDELEGHGGACVLRVNGRAVA